MLPDLASVYNDRGTSVHRPEAWTTQGGVGTEGGGDQGLRPPYDLATRLSLTIQLT